MYKNFLKFFLTVIAVTLITNDTFATVEPKKGNHNTINTQQNRGNLGIPNDFIYKGKIISPHCIIKRKSDIIDLAKCHKELESNITPIYEISSNANEIRAMVRYEERDENDNSTEGYWIKFIGAFAKEQLAIANYEVYNGRHFWPPCLEIFYFKRNGDQLIIKPLLNQEDDSIHDAYIKNGVLYFSKLLNNQETWLLMKEGAKLQGDVNDVILGAEGPMNYSSKAFFQIHELDIMNSRGIFSSAPLFLPSIPYKIEFCYVCRGSFHAEDLIRNEPVEIWEGKYCSSLPYIEVWLKYEKKGKQILKVDEFASFVQAVKAVCDSYKKKTGTEVRK
ncbi:hypothetical protein [Rickettsia endosymbiont of Aspidapion aeneum]|uniref:hypothetical protein n=1 Tax=Rickettsia endosymbiont of Aspidapion aeneum TaxID=3066247 RepID=UPI00313F1EA3